MLQNALFGVLLAGVLAVASASYTVEYQLKNISCPGLYNACTSDPTGLVSVSIEWTAAGKKGTCERQPWSKTTNILIFPNGFSCNGSTNVTQIADDANLSFELTMKPSGCGDTPTSPKFTDNATIKGPNSISRNVTTSPNCMLAYEVRPICDLFYFGPACAVLCNDSAKGENFTCNKTTGEKLCKTTQFNVKLNCSVYCKPNEFGNYTCDPTTGKKLCEQNYYNANCSKHCIQKMPNYRCDNWTGDIVCEEGFFDVEKKCAVYCKDTTEYACNQTTGKKLCKSNWYGDECGSYCKPVLDVYKCDNVTGEKICLTLSRGENCTAEARAMPANYHTSFVTFCVLFFMLAAANVLVAIYVIRRRRQATGYGRPTLLLADPTTTDTID